MMVTLKHTQDYTEVSFSNNGCCEAADYAIGVRVPPNYPVPAIPERYPPYWRTYVIATHIIQKGIRA